MRLAIGLEPGFPFCLPTLAERTGRASVSSGRDDAFRPAFRRGLILTDKSCYREGLAYRDMADGALVIVIEVPLGTWDASSPWSPPSPSGH